MRVLVLGGNGFVGRAICRKLAPDNQVASLSRSGPPVRYDPAWMDAVTWLAGSAVTDLPETPPNAIIHCVGTLLEGPGRSYRTTSYETLVSAIEKYEYDDVRIGYISADDFNGMARWLLPDYYQWKMKAEQALADAVKKGQISSAVIIRPGVITGWERWPTMPVGAVCNLISFMSARFLPPTCAVEAVAGTVTRELLGASAHQVKIVPAKDIQCC